MNHFAYFTEVEDRFSQRRGSLLLLSTLDWALIETWREAGVPLEAVLRGIDAAFDKHEAQRTRLGARRQRKVNGLAWCAQAVMEAAEQAREAAVGIAPPRPERESGFEAARIARFLLANAAQLDAAVARLPSTVATAAAETAVRLYELAAEVKTAGSTNLEPGTSNLEETDRTLTVLEEKLFAVLLASTSEAELTALRAQADRELAPYRGRMGAVQIRQVRQQFLHKRFLENHSLPRLSLFYMPHQDEDTSPETDS